MICKINSSNGTRWVPNDIFLLKYVRKYNKSELKFYKKLLNLKQTGNFVCKIIKILVFNRPFYVHKHNTKHK